MSRFSSPFMAKSPLNNRWKEFKAKAGRRVRKFFGAEEPKIKKPSEYKS